MLPPMPPAQWPRRLSNASLKIRRGALNQLAKLDAAMTARIPDLPQIVAFRNQLIHGYASVNVGTVWNVVETSLLALLVQTAALLDELGAP